MKFNDIDQEKWSELMPYMDTCLLPITGLVGHEEPWQVAHRLEQLRDALAILEVPYHGRLVTYPAYHYGMNSQSIVDVNEICKNLKKSGFAFVVVLTTHQDISRWEITDADVLCYIDMELPFEEMAAHSQRLAKKMIELWTRR